MDKTGALGPAHARVSCGPVEDRGGFHRERTDWKLLDRKVLTRVLRASEECACGWVGARVGHVCAHNKGKRADGPKETREDEEEEKEPAIGQRGTGSEQDSHISQRSSKAAAVSYYLAACRWPVQRHHFHPRRWAVIFGDAATLTPGRTGTLLSRRPAIWTPQPAAQSHGASPHRKERVEISGVCS